MKSLIVLVVGLLSVGCGKTDTERLEQENKRPKAQLESKKLKPRLEAESQKKTDDLLRLDVLGEYELKSIDGTTFKFVFLVNGIEEVYRNGKKLIEHKWSIVDGEIHVKYDSGLINILRINADKSISIIAIIEDGKRTDYSKEDQSTFKKIK